MDTNLKQYFLYAGKFAKEDIDIDLSQAKNTADELTYRIPSLLSVKDNEGRNVVISAIDLSERGSDSGRVQVVSRVSVDGGKSFGEMKTVLSLPVSKTPQGGEEYNCAFAIDPILTQCKNGDILIIVDVYPESMGIMRRSWLDKGSGYVTVDGKSCLALYSEKTKVGTGRGKKRARPFTVRENGFVYTPDGEKTNYYLPKNHSAEYAFETLGDMYYAVGTPDYIDTCPPMIPEEGEGKDIYCGNVFLSEGKGEFFLNNPTAVKKRVVSPEKSGDEYSKYKCVETKPAPLSVTVNNYLYAIRSKDFGQTWEQPVDITATVMTEKEFFVGTGPGIAICLKNQNDKSKNGRLLAPVYNLLKTSVIYSDDNGKTWKRSSCSKNIDESQLVELSDGTVLCFGRQRMLGKTPCSVSVDGGETWEKAGKAPLSSIRCQKSVIAVPKSSYTNDMDKNKDYLLFCASSGTLQKNSKRFFGTITVAEVGDDKKIKPLKQRTIVSNGVRGKYKNFFAYSSLAALENGNFAVLFEGLPSGLGTYMEFTLDWLLSGDEPYSFPIPLKAKLGL